MDHQSQLPLDFFHFRNIEKNSDILSMHESAYLDENYSKKQENSLLNFTENAHISPQKVKAYFDLLFSPQVVAESLIKRNQFLEMKCIDNSESEPEQLYNRRAKRVISLQQKQCKNWQVLNELKETDSDKYDAISNFMRLFGEVKERIKGIRHDYYSQKTFLALKKCPTPELRKVTKILSSVLNSVMSAKNKPYIQDDKGVDQRLIEFLIIPRFFISKQKLLKLVANESLQKSFELLIYHGCLGHYNNEANKKLPEETQMKYVKQLLEGRDGKEKFKKICTINHGGNFLKKYGNLYYELYYKNLECLKRIAILSKKKFTYSQLTDQMSKNDFILESDREEEKIGLQIPKGINEFQIEWPQGAYELKSVSSFLNSIGKEDKDNEPKFTKATSNMIKSVFIDNGSTEKSKFKVKRFQSLMESSQLVEKPKNRLKKSFTLELPREANIILIHPPSILNSGFNFDD